MPDGITAAKAIGVTLDGVAAHPFRGIRFRDRERTAEVSGRGHHPVHRPRFVDLDPAWGLAPSAARLDRLLGGRRVARTGLVFGC